MRMFETGVCDELPWLAPGGVCRFTSAVLNYPRKLAKCIRRDAPAKSLQGPYGLVAEPRGGKAWGGACPAVAQGPCRRALNADEA